MVETNALFYRDHIKPVMAGEVKEDIKAVLLRHFENHEDIIAAAAECNFERALKAFKNDPQVKAKCTDSQAEELLRYMIQSNLKYLPEGWRHVG